MDINKELLEELLDDYEEACGRGHFDSYDRKCIEHFIEWVKEKKGEIKLFKYRYHDVDEFYKD